MPEGQLSQASLEGRVAVVTGAGGGIGAATALALANRGAQVVIAEINAERGQAVADRMTAAGLQAIAHSTDIGDEQSVADVVAAALEWGGSLDILVNNAAVTSSTLHVDKGVADTPPDVWQLIFGVNLFGTVAMCRAAIPAMVRQGSGAIVNVGSIDGVSPSAHERVAYSTSKAALHYVTRHIAASHGKQGIRCNLVAPGSTTTETFHAAVSQDMIDRQLADGNYLLPYLASPEDLAAAITFLASDDSRSITGQVLQVDAGATSHKAFGSTNR